MADCRMPQQLLAERSAHAQKSIGNVRNGFERRLRFCGGRGRLWIYYECVRVCCLEAGEAFHKRHSAHSEGNDFRRSALTLLHARACLVASEVHGLLTSGHAAGAQARLALPCTSWRSSRSSRASTIPRSLNASCCIGTSRDTDATQYQQYCEALGYEQFSAEEMEETRQLHDEVIAKYEPSFRNDWGWAVPLFPAGKKPNFAELEKIAGLEHLRPWVRLSSHGIHSGATGTIHVMGFHSGSPRRRCCAGPSGTLAWPTRATAPSSPSPK